MADAGGCKDADASAAKNQVLKYDRYRKMTDDIHASHAPGLHPTPESQAMRARRMAATQHEKKLVIAQQTTKYAVQDMLDAGTFNPMTIVRKFERLEEKAKRALKDETEKVSKEEELPAIERITEIADQYERKNPELQARSLLFLRQSLAAGDSMEEVMRKVLDMYPDVSLADDALDFLMETTDGKLRDEVGRSKTELNTLYGREIRAGKNIAEEARTFAKQGLGPPTDLRSYYRDIIANPRDAYSLFDELTSRVVTYDKLKKFIDFLLHSIGSDLKSKGPSIDRGELYRLLTEARNMQSFLGIFRFFLSRMALISNSFTREQLRLPAKISFELLARQFVKLLGERYISAEKVLALAAQLGLSEEIIAQIIIFTQMRDAVRGVAPRLYKNKEHRDDMLSAIIEAIETLDEQLEEEEGEEEEEEEDE